MKRRRLSTVRKALFWWFRWPADPYICVSFVVDASAGKAYLADLGGDPERAVTLHHLVTAAVSRVLQDYPRANDRVGRGKLYERRKTGLAMPVDLKAGDRPGEQETAMAVIDDTAGLSLVEIARRSRDVVKAERRHRSRLAWVRWLTAVADHTPYGVLAPLLSGFDRLVRVPPFEDLLFGRLPGSGVTNVGAALAGQQGVLFRGGSFTIPQRLMHVGTVWGVSAIQDEVIAVDGVPAVRPMLPVVLCFDHRLFDGVYAGRLIVRFAEILQDPAAEFGRDGRRLPAR